MNRRNMSPYHQVKQDGVEIFVRPELVRQSRNLHIELKEFLFLRNLKAEVELKDGVVLGRRNAET